MKVLKSIGFILLMGLGLIIMRYSGSFVYDGGVFHNLDSGVWVSHEQYLVAGTCIILMGIVGLYTLLRNKM
jgi:hypothetical protein